MYLPGHPVASPLTDLFSGGGFAGFDIENNVLSLIYS